MLECKQSVANLVKMNTSKGSWMSWVMDIMHPELSKLSDLELEKFPCICKYKPISTKLGQSVYDHRSRMSSIMDIIRPERPELFTFELGKNAELDFFYSLASTNINQLVPKVVKMNMTLRSQMSSIMDLIGPELSELSVLVLEKLPYLTLFTIQHLQI